MDPFIGEIRAFAFDYPPMDWLPCDGRLLQINAYNALFSLLGNRYGGDGITNFALPDLRGRTVIGVGNGTGLTPRPLAQKDGAEGVTLTDAQMKGHSHSINNNTVNARATLKCSSGEATVTTPVAGAISKNAKGVTMLRFNTSTPDAAMIDGSIALSGFTDTAGGSQPHPNMQPSLVLNYCIAWAGVYPPRS
jgi:microcystin-dependent protein